MPARSDCEAVLAYAEHPLADLSVDDAAMLAYELTASYPQRGDMTDPVPYTKALVNVLVSYPALIAREVVRETRETAKYLPTIAELHDALKAKVERRQRLGYMARAAIKEIDRRKVGNTPDDMERRRQFVANVVAPALASIRAGEAERDAAFRNRVPSATERRYMEIAAKARKEQRVEKETRTPPEADRGGDHQAP